MSAIGSLFRDGVPLIDEQLAPIKSNDTPFACVIPVPNEDYPEYSAFVFRADAAELGYLLSKCQELQTLNRSDPSITSLVTSNVGSAFFCSPADLRLSEEDENEMDSYAVEYDFVPIPISREQYENGLGALLKSPLYHVELTDMTAHIRECAVYWSGEVKHSDDRLWTASVAVEDLMDIIAGIN